MITGNPAFLTSFLTSVVNVGQLNVVGQCSLRIYDGAMPSDAQAQVFNPATFASQLVCTFTGLSLSVIGSALVLNTVPAATTASRATTLVWGALIGQNSTGLILQAGLSGGTGSVVLSTLTPALNGAVALVDAGIRIVFYQ